MISDVSPRREPTPELVVLVAGDNARDCSASALRNERMKIGKFYKEKF